MSSFAIVPIPSFPTSGMDTFLPDAPVMALKINLNVSSGSTLVSPLITMSTVFVSPTVPEKLMEPLLAV